MSSLVSKPEPDVERVVVTAGGTMGWLSRLYSSSKPSMAKQRGPYVELGKLLSLHIIRQYPFSVKVRIAFHSFSL